MTCCFFSKVAPWATVFCSGLVASAALNGERRRGPGSPCSGWEATPVGVSDKAGEVGLFLFIFGNNTFIAFLCLVLGKPSRAFFSTLVCALNGTLAGAALVALSHWGVESSTHFPCHLCLNVGSLAAPATSGCLGLLIPSLVLMAAVSGNYADLVNWFTLRKT